MSITHFCFGTPWSIAPPIQHLSQICSPITDVCAAVDPDFLKGGVPL